jgi:hypothetical protein
MISNNKLDQMSSPPVSKGNLGKFLTYLDRKKIVLNKTKEEALCDQRINPLLLASSGVTHKDLKDFGFSFGKACHVKTKAEYWYHGRKREYQEEHTCAKKRARTRTFANSSFSCITKCFFSHQDRWRGDAVAYLFQ